MSSKINQNSVTPPIFILSSERSGSNLLRIRITQNQQAYFGPAPAHFFKHLYYSQAFYGNLADDKNFKALVEDAINLTVEHFSPWDVQFDIDAIIEEYDQLYQYRNSILIGHHLMLKYARLKGYSSYVCKDNHLFEFGLAILKYIPDAKFIYLYRDPRDYYLSQMKRTQQKTSYEICKMWKREQLQCLSLGEELRPEQLMRISYENMVADEKGQIEQLLEFLNVSSEEQVNNVRSVLTKAASDTEDWKNINKPTIKDNFNKYKKELSTKKIDFIEAICWDEMLLLGYSTTTNKKPGVSNLQLGMGLLKDTIKFRLVGKVLKSEKPNNIKKRSKRRLFLKRFKTVH